jgi:hypothetical protein
MKTAAADYNPNPDFWEACDTCGAILAVHFGKKPPRPKELWCPACAHEPPNLRTIFKVHPLFTTMKNMKKKQAKKPKQTPSEKTIRPMRVARTTAAPKPRKASKSSASPLEKVVEKKVCDYAKTVHKCYVRKFTSPQQRSVPDRLIITPAGRTFFIEFKRQGGFREEKMVNSLPNVSNLGVRLIPTPVPPTVSQLAEHEAIQACNTRVFIVCDVEEGRNIIDEQCMGL